MRIEDEETTEMDVTPAGVAGGQGRSAQEVEDSTMLGGWALLGLALIVLGAVVYKVVCG